MDHLSKSDRSALMSRIRSRDTIPELVVRSVLHALDYRFRVCAQDLPGRPDVVFRGMRKAIFIHGCFWHGHSCRMGLAQPRSNVDYWSGKLLQNVRRDAAVRTELIARGWEVLEVWECQVKTGEWLERAIEFLESDSKSNTLGCSGLRIRKGIKIGGNQ